MKTKARSKPAKTGAAKKKAPVLAPEAKKEKRIRGTFSMPASDYALIAELKSRAKTAGRIVKKNVLLRAGLQTLAAMTKEQLQAAFAKLAPSDSVKKAKA